MNNSYQVRHAVHQDDYAHYSTQRIRDNFIIADLFAPDDIQLTYTHYDRIVVGGAMPVTTALSLNPIDAFKAAYFCERRELGVINVGGKGRVVVDGEAIELDFKEAVYIGRGSQSVDFFSHASNAPAKFYLLSAPAHANYPIQKVGRHDAEVVNLGSRETANERTINKLLVNGVVQTCQLQMGMTELKPGSVWNTMPAHTHDRRMEVYFYFEVPEEQAVCHFMGPVDDTRHIWMGNEQAVISPPWSIHSGAGTSHYTFIWGMAGENLDYGDMDFHTPRQFAEGE